MNAQCQSQATQDGLRQVEDIKYQALLISVFVASCERQPNLWKETRDICRLSVSVPIYASPQKVVDYCK